jgi:dihydroorotate dehydrogenase electron transfer subunit
MQLELFETIGNVYTTTEDAILGEKGFVTNHSILNNEQFDLIATCGPKPMMKAVAAWARTANCECEVSLENMMACGVGACLCCVEKDGEGHNVCVCKEGPVFNSKKLNW